jgi:glycosyltransferase involved in cell wall biosynthesis
MRVYLTTIFDLTKAGGITTNLKMLKKGLEYHGHQAEIVFCRENIIKKLFFYLSSLSDYDKYLVNYFNFKLEYLTKIFKNKLYKEKIDVIHCHDVAICSFLSKNLDIPIVLTVHGPFSKEIDMVGLKNTKYYEEVLSFERYCYENPKIVITAVDSGQRDIIVNDYNVSKEKIIVILNAVDIYKFSPKNKFENNNQKYILFPRRLVPKNGGEVAILAMRKVKEGIQLWLAGDGIEKNKLIEIAKKHNVINRIKFLGEVNNDKMAELMSGAIAIIVPSVPVKGVVEASSIAALEGMSAGKPVIASNIGGLKEIIKNNDTGILVEPGNDIELAKKINWVIENPKEIIRIGNNARNYVIKYHSIPSVSEKYIKLYEMAKKI